MSTYGIANSNLISLLYKKYLGVIDGNPFTTVYEQTLWNVRPRIIPSLQIMAQPIPSTAPSVIGEPAFADGNGGTIYYPAAYPQLAYYSNITLVNTFPQTSSSCFFYSNSPNVTTNLLSLQNVIPPVYDPNGSYKIAVSVNGSLWKCINNWEPVEF